MSFMMYQKIDIQNDLSTQLYNHNNAMASPAIVDIQNNIKSMLITLENNPSSDSQNFIDQLSKYVLKDEIYTEDFVKWITDSANKGNSYAMTHLAIIYYNGKGVEKSFLHAHVWLDKSVSKNNIYAMFILSCILKDTTLDSYKSYGNRLLVRSFSLGCESAKKCIQNMLKKYGMTAFTEIMNDIQAH